jgi:hypothetical protein
MYQELDGQNELFPMSKYVTKIMYLEKSKHIIIFKTDGV